MKKLISLFIFIGIVHLTASVAGAQTFTVLGTVTNDTDPAMFEPHQFDVTSFFPETTSATVSFDLKNDTPPIPGPGDNPNDLAFTSDPTTAEISVAKLTGEFQFRFEYVVGADTSHLRDVKLILDGVVFRDQFAAFNDHLGSASLGTARMGGGIAVNSLGQSGPVAQIYLLPFFLQSIVSGFSFSADDLVNLAFDPTASYAYDPPTVARYPPALLSADSGEVLGFRDLGAAVLLNALFEGIPTYGADYLEAVVRFEEVRREYVATPAGQALVEARADAYSILIENSDSPARYAAAGQIFNEADAAFRAGLDAHAGENALSQLNEALAVSDALAAERAALRASELGTIPDLEAPLTNSDVSELSEAENWGNQEYYIDIVGPDGDSIIDALNFQDQSDMNNRIESVIPELAAFVVQ